MKTGNLFLKLSLLISTAVLISNFLASCEFCGRGVAAPLCSLRTDSPLTNLTSSNQNVVFENPGTIIVYHGNGCSESNEPGEKDVLNIEESLDIPSYANN